LITKLDAIGDVLRTTSLLPSLLREMPGAYIVWITRESAAPLFLGNTMVDEVWIAEVDALARLSAETFDLVINTDTDRWTAAFATAAQAKEKRGFTLSENGTVVASGPAAQAWLETGASDALKKANARTYQKVIHEIACVPYVAHPEIQLHLNCTECQTAQQFLAVQGRNASKPLLGVNLGGGGRWKKKRWTEEHLKSFMRDIQKEDHYDLLMIGGKDEEPLLNQLQAALLKPALRNPPGASLRQTAAIIAECAALITGDSLALHMATALKVPVIALFGPTSSTEIELYGRGLAVVAPVPCVCCYLTDCNISPDCRQSITPATVKAALAQLMASRR
jgi:heptosyltransferase-2